VNRISGDIKSALFPTIMIVLWLFRTKLPLGFAGKPKGFLLPAGGQSHIVTLITVSPLIASGGLEYEI
jgi:hypothetical protein